MTTTPQSVDPRAGHTSASNAGADAACTGRHLAQKGILSTPSQYSESGRKVHAALAVAAVAHDNRPLLEKLSLEERETYQACLDIQRKLVSQHFAANHAGYKEFREQRYWAKFKVNGQEYQHSGQADFVGRAGTRALIIDYKTLPGEVAESPSNMQLRDLACLVRGTYVPTDEIAVAIVQPYVTHSPQLCVYGKEELDRATKEMFQRVFACNQPDAKRIAGEVQCKYCRAKGACVEYQKWAGQITPPAMLTILGVPMASWTPQQCAIAAGALAPCEKFLDELKGMLKHKLANDPASVPGWELKPGAVRESIKNPQAVFERFASLGGKVDQFMVCVDVAKGRLKEVLNNLTGAKGKALEAAMKTLTDGCMESKQTAPSLKRKDDAA